MSDLWVSLCDLLSIYWTQLHLISCSLKLELCLLILKTLLNNVNILKGNRAWSFKDRAITLRIWMLQRLNLFRKGYRLSKSSGGGSQSGPSGIRGRIGRGVSCTHIGQLDVSLSRETLWTTVNSVNMKARFVLGKKILVTSKPQD